MGRILGFALLGGGLLVSILVIGLMTTYYGEGSLTAGAAFLGVFLGLVILVLPQFGVGAVLLWRGGQEAKEGAYAAQQRQLLDIVKTRGQVNIADLVIEMKSSRDQVQKMLNELVGMGLFAGYVNWEKGVLYSRQASQLRQLKQCENCSGQLELAGKGVVRCPYCGTEYFLD